MYKLAIIQNLIEIQNNTAAEIKGQLENKFFEIQYINRDNIDCFFDNSWSGIDCIIIGSNALRDEQIAKRFDEQKNKDKLWKYISEKDGAVIILHQFFKSNTEIDIFGQKDEMSFHVIRKPEKEEKNKEKIRNIQGVLDQYFCFPNEINLSLLENDMKNNAYYPRVYWSIFQTKTDDWTVFAINDESEPLLRVSKKYKVILSSMVLDWQHCFNLVENLIVNTICKRSIGYIGDTNIEKQIAQEELQEDLRKNGIYVCKYNISNSEDINRLEECLKRKLHIGIVVFSKETEKRELLKRLCEKNETKLFCINDNNEIQLFDYENKYVSEYMLQELEIQKALREGYVENSFNLTANILKILKNCDYSRGNYDAESLKNITQRVISEISDNGSYGESYGATCKAIWYFSEIAKDESRVKKAKEWVRKFAPQPFEYIREELKYVEIMNLPQEEIKKYIDNVKDEDKKLEQKRHNRTVYETIAAYDLAAKCGEYYFEYIEDLISSLILRKEYSTDEEIKICLCLLQYEKTYAAKSKNIQLLRNCDGFLVNHVTELKEVQKTIGEGYYLKKLEIAFLLCEYEKVKQYSNYSVSQILNTTSAKINFDEVYQVVETLRENNEILKADLENEKKKNSIAISKKNNEIRILKNRRILYWFLLTFFVISGYVLIWSLFWAVKNDLLNKWAEELISKYWGIHVTLIPVVITAVKIILNKRKIDLEKHIKIDSDSK